MADTLGEAYVKIRTDSTGIKRGVEEALGEAGKSADEAGKQAGEDWAKGWGKQIEDELGKSDAGDSFNKGFQERWKTALDSMAKDGRSFEERWGGSFRRLQEMSGQGVIDEQAAARDHKRIEDAVADLRSYSDGMASLRRMRDNYDQGVSRSIARNTALSRSYRSLDRDMKAVKFGGLLGDFQSFGHLLLSGSIDMRNWKNGLRAVTETVVGFGKSVYKAAILLGPLAGGLSQMAGIVTAFGGSIQTGLIGGLAAMGPLAIAGAASMLVFGQAIKAFGKHATDAQQKAVKPIQKQITALQAVIQKNVFANIAEQGKLLIPVMNQLKTSLGGVATAVSNTFTGILKVVGPAGQAHDAFVTLTGSLGSLSTKLGQVVTNLISGFVGAMAQAVPFATRLANSLIALTSRFAAFANSAKGKAALTTYFERGYQAASKIMKILGTLGVALFKVLNIGDKTTGESFLDSMLASVQKFNNYVSSSKGIQNLKGWFTDAKYAAHSLALAFDAVGKAFGNLDTGGTRTQFRNIVDTVTGLINGFANLIPKVQGMTGLMSPLGASAYGVWTSIKKLVGTVADLYTKISETGATTVLSGALDILGGAIDSVNGLLQVLSPLITGIARAFAALPGPIQNTVIAMYALKRVGLVGFMSDGITKVKAFGTAFATAGGGTGVGAMARGVKNLAPMIGRGALNAAKSFWPLGVAIGAVSLGLGILAYKHKQAAAAAAAHKADVDQLTKAMQEQGNVSGGTVDKTVQQMLADKGAFKAAKDLGVSLTTVMDATIKGGAAKKQFATNTNIATTADARMHLQAGKTTQSLTDLQKSIKGSSTAAADSAAKTDKNAKNWNSLKSTVDEVGSALDDAQAKWLAQAQAMSSLQNSATSVNPLIQDLQKQMDTYADSTQTATTRTDAFASALNELTDKSMSTEEAAIKQADSMRALDGQFGRVKDSSGKLLPAQTNIRKAFIGNTTSLNDSSKAASDLVNNFKSNVVPAFADVVRAAFDAAGGVKNLGPATIAAKNAAAQYDAELKTKLTKSFHLTGAQADELIKKFHLMPGDVTTLSKLIGGKATTKQLEDIIKKSKDVGLTPIQLKANAKSALDTALGLQTSINKVKQGKVIGLKADSSKGRATVADLNSKVNKIKQAVATSLKANPASADSTIGALKARLNKIIQTHPTKLGADPDPAVTSAKSMLAWLNNQQATIDVHANMTPAEQAVADWHPDPKSIQVAAQITKGGYFNKQMTGGIVDRPTFTLMGERGLREAVVPLDLPLSQVNPSVRAMSALLRGGGGGGKASGNGAQPQKITNNTINVYPQAADPTAVSQSLLNQLTVLGR